MTVGVDAPAQIYSDVLEIAAFVQLFVLGPRFIINITLSSWPTPTQELG